MSVITVASQNAWGEDVSVRGAHWSVGAGGALYLTGSENKGALISGDFYPGASLDRLGFRIEARGAGTSVPRTLLAGIALEAAAARPRLVLSLYATLGASFDGEGAIAVGLQTQLFVVGPLAIGLDSGGLLIVDGVSDTELRLGSALTVRVGR